MAQAKTYQLENFNTLNWMNDCPCKVCGAKEGTEWRVFYYPTYMNGDAEYIGSWCDEHKKEAKEALDLLLRNKS